MSFIALLNDDVVEEANNFYDLYRILNDKEKDLDHYEYDYKGELKDKRIFVKTRLSDNIVNYVAVACGLSRTVGFPAKLLGGVRIRDIEEVNTTKVGNAYDIIIDALLSSDAESVDDVFKLIHEVKRYNDSKAIAPDVFEKAIENCYDDFYAQYWENIKMSMEIKATRFERILNAIKALDCLEYIAGKPFPTSILECFIVDVFRNGGNIYYALPNRIVLTSSSSSTFTLHQAIGHEGGHIIMKGWDKIDEIHAELTNLKDNVGKAQYLEGYIDECIAALFELKMGEHILHEGRETNSIMGDAFFKILNSLYTLQDHRMSIDEMLLWGIRRMKADGEFPKRIK